jgi:molybdate transport system substrate-binding protein
MSIRPWYRWRIGLLALLCSLWMSPALTQGRSVVTVAAASDLKFAMDELISLYEQERGQRVRSVYGSSGQFFTQILQGAPFDLFMSADEAFIDQLFSHKKVQDRGALYAVGRIVLFTPRGSPVRADAAFADLRLALSDGRLRKLALANPEHAP